jgi:CubicO group peptidase (beta-lactamase class C family)
MARGAAWTMRNWRQYSAFTFLAAAIWPTASAAQKPIDLASIGPFLDSVMVSEGIPGLSFAAFSDEGVLYAHAIGVKNALTGEPVDGETVFEAASITKPVFAFAVLSLALEGALDLDAPLAGMVAAIPELAYDERSALLTPRMLLGHQGGLPNWRSRLRFEATRYDELFDSADTLRFLSEPGSAYRYSGEGYVLLQRVIEEHTGTSIQDLVERRVFEPLGMRRSSLEFDESVRANASFGHNSEAEPDKWIIGVPLASSTLHTTARDLALFGVELASQLQQGGPYARLASPQVRVAQNDNGRLSWGLGLGVVEGPSGTFVYHGGNNVIFIADFLYSVDHNLGYALLTNSANGQRVVEALERRVFGRPVRR